MAVVPLYYLPFEFLFLVVVFSYAFAWGCMWIVRPFGAFLGKHLGIVAGIAVVGGPAFVGTFTLVTWVINDKQAGRDFGGWATVVLITAPIAVLIGIWGVIDGYRGRGS